MKDKFINADQLLKQMRTKNLIRFIDRLSFSRIFIIWACVIVSFGFIYYFFVSNANFLFYQIKQENVITAADSVYFSFITATTTGFGDIVPFGVFRAIAIVEVICGLLLLAVVTSKLVSIKQDVILNELYELSLNERVNRMRSSLLLFRQNLSRIIAKIEEGAIQKREVTDIYVYLSSFEDMINEVNSMIQLKDDGFTKRIDPTNMELVLISIINSFEKLNELLNIMNQHKIEWKRDITLSLIKRCISIDDEIYVKLGSSKSIMTKIFEDLKARKDKAVGVTKSELEQKPTQSA